MFTDKPKLVLNPSGNTPLTASLVVKTEVPTQLSIKVSGGIREVNKDYGGDFSTDHSVLIHGLEFNIKHSILITVENMDGISDTELVSGKVEKRPNDFPDFEFKTLVPEKREPGLTIFVVNQITPENLHPHNGRLVAMNKIGEVVWVYNLGAGIGCITLTSKNNILVTSQSSLFEINWKGEQLGHWYTYKLGAEKVKKNGTHIDFENMHHSAIELPNGNILAIGTELRHLEAYPTDELNENAPTQSVDVKGDVIAEFTRKGDIIRRHSLFDILDPNRIGYYSVVSGEGGATPGGNLDWSHSNGLFYDASDNSYLISIRHQDAIAKIGLEDGDLRWIIGDHHGWGFEWQKFLLSPIGGMEWQYHQHDPSISPSGTILCFDNGNCRAIPYKKRKSAEQSYSRVVEYAVDEANRDIREVWSFGGPDGEVLYSSSQGGAAFLPTTGNIFCNFSAIRLKEDGTRAEDNISSRRHARLIEVTHDDKPIPVFDLEIKDKSNRNIDFASFRSFHVRDMDVV